MVLKRLTYVTAGAAGMYCGSCMHDNALARALIRGGVDTLLVPVYTPIRTDEANVSTDRVFFGGINLFLRQKLPFFHLVPAPLARLFDVPALLRFVTGEGGGTDRRLLGTLTVSMLQGKHGAQAEEVDRMCDWLQREAHPDAVVMSNLLIGGCIPEIRRRLGVPIVVMLQGDDIFLDYLPANYRTQAIDLLQQLAQQVDAFVVNSKFYGQRMTKMLRLPEDRVHVLPLSIDPAGFLPAAERPVGAPPTVGYLARLSPDKGLDRMVDAFLLLAKRDPEVQLHTAGWLGAEHRKWTAAQFDRLRHAGLDGRFQYHGSPDHAGKIKFLQSIDVLSVPTQYEDPKGLFVLEALAAGVPVVQPAHGAFPELLEMTGGGILVPPGDAATLASHWEELLRSPHRRLELGARGRAAVLAGHNIDAAASRLKQLIESLEASQN